MFCFFLSFNLLVVSTLGFELLLLIKLLLLRHSSLCLLDVLGEVIRHEVGAALTVVLFQVIAIADHDSIDADTEDAEEDGGDEVADDTNEDEHEDDASGGEVIEAREDSVADTEGDAGEDDLGEEHDVLRDDSDTDDSDGVAGEERQGVAGGGEEGLTGHGLDDVSVAVDELDDGLEAGEAALSAADDALDTFVAATDLAEAVFHPGHGKADHLDDCDD